MRNETLNYEMLVMAREIRGLTQSALVKQTQSISQGNLSRMEKGKLSISDQALEEISKALKFPKSFFYLGSVKTPINDFYYRKRVSIPKKKLSKLEASIDLVRIGLDILFSDFELPTFGIPHIDIDETGITPEEAARKIRAKLGLKKGPVNNFIGLLEQQGIVVFPIASESDKFDGISLFTDDQYPIIFINEAMPNDRKRFTLAHELGHLVLHIRSPFDDRSDDLKEEEANRFASEFLMPELDIRNDLAGLTMTNLLPLKSYWQVSMKSLVYRAKSLRVISSKRATNLYIELSRQGYVKNEPGLVELDDPQIIKKTIHLLKTELDYSISDISDNLCMSLDDFKKYFMGQKQNTVKLKVLHRQ